MSEQTITILNPMKPKERFVLKGDKTLERLAEDKPAPEGRIAVIDLSLKGYFVEEMEGILKGVAPWTTARIIEDEDTCSLKYVESPPKGQKVYGSPEEFIVYMKLVKK